VFLYLTMFGTGGVGCEILPRQHVCAFLCHLLGERGRAAVSHSAFVEAKPLQPQACPPVQIPVRCKSPRARRSTSTRNCNPSVSPHAPCCNSTLWIVNFAKKAATSGGLQTCYGRAPVRPDALPGLARGADKPGSQHQRSRAASWPRSMLQARRPRSSERRRDVPVSRLRRDH
jgi:hypothetical protein